jgi:hypothetical protein
MPHTLTPERYENLFLVAYAGLRPLALSEEDEEAIRAGESARRMVLFLPRLRKILLEQHQKHPDLLIQERIRHAVEKLAEGGDRLFDGLQEFHEIIGDVRDLLRSERADDGPQPVKTWSTLSGADAAVRPESIDPCDRTIEE